MFSGYSVQINSDNVRTDQNWPSACRAVGRCRNIPTEMPTLPASGCAGEHIHIRPILTH